MDLGFTPAERAFRAQVGDAFAAPAMRQALAVARSGARDPRPVYRVLGERGLLAPNWPSELGGRGRPLVEAGCVIEQLTAHDVADLLWVISVLTVGNLLLTVGPAGRHEKLLTGMARGERYACVMFTEPGAGSDLAAVTSTGRPCADGLVLAGRKVHGIATRYADYGLCLVRTGEGGSRYTGLTLVLVPMRAPGVQVTPVSAVGPDDFHEVTMDDVVVPADAVVGPMGGAWPVLEGALALERCGLDYYAKAARWYLCASDLAQDAGVRPREDVRIDLSRFAARLRAAGLMAYRQLARIDRGQTDPAGASAAKWFASELAADIAAWIPERLGQPDTDPAGQGAPYWEGPGLRMSGGTAEMLLETIASEALEAPRLA